MPRKKAETVTEQSTETEAAMAAIVSTEQEESSYEQPQNEDLPVLTIDRYRLGSMLYDESEKNQQEAIWHEIKNALITHKILTGYLDGVETTPKDNYLIGVTTYKGYRVIIPAGDLIETPNGTASTGVERIVSSMIGAEISFMITRIDNESRAVIASRVKANERNRKTFFFDLDSNGKYKIYEGSVCEARVIGTGRNSIRVEVFGAECTIYSRELSWDWISNASDEFSIGDRVMVKITGIKGRENTEEPFTVSASIRQTQSSKQEELLKTVSNGNLYSGQVVDIRKGTYLIKLSNGANALAHSSHSRKNVMRGDTVAFVVNHIDRKTMMITGQIIRIIHHNRR